MLKNKVNKKKQNKSITYLARVDKEKNLGIYAKLVHSRDAFEEAGYDVKLVLVNGVGGFKALSESTFTLLGALFRCRSDIIIVRSDLFMLPLAIGLIWQRMLGSRIIVDVPTPIVNWIDEQNFHSNTSSLKASIKKLVIRLSFPWALLPANKVVQYAKESDYYSFGLASKISIYGNGIDVNKISVRGNCPPFHKTPFIFIGVASVAEWHGFDRVIKGIHEYTESRGYAAKKVKFIVVGDGPGRSGLEALCDSLNLRSKVDFVGFKSGIELDKLFEDAHVAVSSIGLHRVGLELSSSLKSREYTARGIPFLFAGRDVDYEPLPSFVHPVDEDESHVDIEKVLIWYEELRPGYEMITSIRSFAELKLSFGIKSAEFLS